MTSPGPQISNPKRTKRTSSKKEAWFNYYAGFSARFVEDAIREVRLSPTAVVFDPWNGSGTTTSTAHEMGYRSIGIDANPVMVVVARAKLLHRGVYDSLIPLAEELLSKAQDQTVPSQENPLHTWLVPSSACVIRAIADSIASVLTSHSTSLTFHQPDVLANVSDLAAFYVVALFRTLRSLLQPFQASNPTWIKSPSTPHSRLRPGTLAIQTLFKSYVAQMADAVTFREAAPQSEIRLGTSAALPNDLTSVDAVISSPPYCTRIDYAVATKPELALLGYPVTTEFHTLRRQLIGSPVVCDQQPAVDPLWGDTCIELLKKVKSHPSKGSGNYYHKLFLQYFHDMRVSLAEIDRVLAPGGQCVLVVQDSYYKTEHIDVAQVFVEMASTFNWTLKHRLDFSASSLMARINPKSKQYLAVRSAFESVLWFRAA